MQRNFCDRLIEIAMEYREAGISTFPLWLGGDRNPAIKSFNPYRKRLPTLMEIKSWFSDPRGMAVLCGVISGGLEVIDFDYWWPFPDWYRAVESIAVRLPIVDTPSGGAHVYYRCKVICKSKKIAMNSKLVKPTLIETRGEGGYVVGCPSPADVHPKRYPYVQTAGPVLPEVPYITPEERRMLWQAARTFDCDGSLEKARSKSKNQFQHTGRHRKNSWNTFSGDSRLWSEVLFADGWQSCDSVFWTRPGKEQGVSAALRPSKSGDLVLVVFSTNANVPEQTHGLQSYLAHARFNGNQKQAFAYLKELQR
ncbi:MAG: bifunctional DNA primase/polymerase [Pirellulaceae bacterium]|nr:bifunctional DNA primase/polymerase [Pirellulaceae bacterium]